MSRFSRRGFLVTVAGAVAAVGTRSWASASARAADAPTYRVGDRWEYAAQEGFRSPARWREVHEVVGVDGNGIRVRVTQKGERIDTDRTEVWSAPGLVSVGAVFDAETRRFTGQLKRFDFPLTPGKSWNQRIRNYNEELRREGEIQRRVKVADWTSVSTPAGTFDALRLRVSMRLDDEEFYRKATECSYVTWYAPAVANFVRDEREAQYLEGGAMNQARHRSQHGLLELTSFTKG